MPTLISPCGGAVVSASVPFASMELTTPASPLAAGTYAPTIATLHTNAPGALVFSVDPTKPTYLQVAEPGLYGVMGFWGMSNPATLAVGSAVAVFCGTGGGTYTSPRIALELANTVATKRIQDIQGSSFAQFAIPDQLRYTFSTGQTFSNVGPLLWSIWKVSDDLVT